MWDFPQYTSGERAFSLSQGTSETIGAGTGVGAGARVSRTVLKIRCKLFSEYLGTSLAETTVMGGFAPEGPSDYSENSDSGGKKESWGATEGATEGCSRRGRPRPRTEIILVQTFF